MNLRIQSLAQQSGLTIPDSSEFNGYVYRNAIEKFAESIVRECAQQIIVMGMDWRDFKPSETAIRPEYWNMSQHIQEHFGIQTQAKV